ncbi:MAG: hypothetical protein SGJ09_10900 [Phycisphaerae bacterium]|nr:hypothetical protein [Phycisphaerae bacterium]
MNAWARWRPKATNFTVVTVISLLLWLWAAGRTREIGTVELFVRFVVADADQTAALPIEAVPVEIELQGTRRELDRAAERFTGKMITLRVGRFGVPGTPGTHAIDLAAALSRTEEFDSTGAAVVASTPATTPLEIVETETIESSIVPLLPGVQLVGDAIVEPETVRVTLPRALVPALGAEPHVQAFLPSTQTNMLQSGRRHGVDVTLRVPEALEAQSRLVRIVPDKARVSFTLLSRSSTSVLRLVPVQIAGPPDDLSEFSVDINPADAFLRDVEVTGPSEIIRALEDGRAKAFAIVHLSADDLALRVTRKRVDLWMLPTGVAVGRIGESSDTEPLIRMTVTQRPAH